MVSLLKSHAFFEVQGGLVLDGLITLLYLVKKLLIDSIIQWHLELKTLNPSLDKDGPGFVHPSEIIANSAIREWYKELDVSVY
jgi:hypothetical protein